MSSVYRPAPATSRGSSRLRIEPPIAERTAMARIIRWPRYLLWSRRQGASVLLLNTLGAQNPTLPYQPSPYYSSSRRFRNTLYLRVDDVDGAERCAAELLPLRAEAQTLNERRLIDYDEVFRLKTRALAAIFKAAPEPRGIEAWAKGKGRALRDFATYNALAEELGPAWP